jgi:hypothetical protein
MRESWTDARLDDFAAHTDRRFDTLERRFDRVDTDFRELRGEMNARFERVDAGLDSIQRTMVHAAAALSTAYIAGFAALIGLVATQI